MARSSADDLHLRNQCQAALESGSKVVLSIRVVETRGAAWAKGGRLGRQMAKPRVLAISTKIASPGEKAKAFLHVLKYSSGGVLELAKDYKLKHLSKMELNANDPSGCTFILGFDNLRSQSVAPSLWTMRNKDDRNRLLVSLLNMCRDLQDRLPKVVGIDIVEMALWAKENTPAVSSKTSTAATATEAAEAATSTIEDGPTIAAEDYSNVAVTRDLVSHAEEEDMEALLDAYVMGIGEAEQFSERLRRELLALEAANVHALLENEPLVEEVLKGLEAASLCVEDMDEWLRIFNVKLRHMREDIESIESRNNKLELQSVNNMALLKELEKLLVHLRIPTEVEECLIGDSFDDAQMSKILECCEWLSGALHGLVQNIDPCYVNMRAVKEKRGELEILKSSFVTLSSEFLRCFFSKLVDFMISDLSHFSQKGQLKVPGHDELKHKCMTHARLLQILKVLDKRCLVPLRKVYCHSLNLLLRREAREFANELRASIKTPKNPQGWLEIISTSSQAANTVDTVTNAYFKMLSIFVPLLVDESSFFAYFMGFGVTAHAFPNASNDMNEDFGTMDNDEWECVQISPDDLDSLNASLRDLLDGIQEDFYAVLDWACKIDPLRCISMHGITENYLSEQKSDTSGFVRMLLSELLTRISAQFGKFVDETCHQIERNERNAKQTGVLSYITKFAVLATRMEQYIQGQSRELVDLAYTKIVNVMFVTLERISQADPKYPDIVLIENYAAFQNSLYDLANVVPTLAKFYHQASESYEKACTNHINMIIYIQFEKLFTFAQKIEDSTYTLSPEEIPFQIGLSKADLRKILKSSLSSVDKAIVGMSKRLQKNFTSEELLPSLWDKCKKQFADKYESFTRLVAKVYPTENIPSATEMRDLLASM